MRLQFRLATTNVFVSVPLNKILVIRLFVVCFVRRHHARCRIARDNILKVMSVSFIARRRCTAYDDLAFSIHTEMLFVSKKLAIL